MRGTYQYLTKQVQTKEFKHQIYLDYIKLINVCHFPNREEVSLTWINIIHKQCCILLDRDHTNPSTFVLLNNEWHWLKMHQVVDLIKIWSINPLYHGYASESEFFEVMDFLRKQFNDHQINIYKAVGKWPRKFRKRFQRIKD